MFCDFIVVIVGLSVFNVKCTIWFLSCLFLQGDILQSLQTHDYLEIHAWYSDCSSL